MASLGHLAVGAALGRVATPGATSRARAGAMLLLGGAAMLPDLDVIAFPLRIPYAAEWGHRGAAHSLLLGLAAGLVLAGLARLLGAPWRRAWLVCTVAVVSHGLLDTLTDGGLGVALLWPWDLTRYFAPLRPIPVAPIGPHFLSARGLYCSAVELVEFLPLWLFAFWRGGTSPPNPLPERGGGNSGPRV